MSKDHEIPPHNYVLGFCFDEFNNVLMIQKSHPDWMRGQLNGIGGKIELYEAPNDAMVREFQEETLIQTTSSDWVHFALLRFETGEIHVFKTTLKHEVLQNRPQQPTDEEVYLVSKFDMNLYDTVPYTDSLISLASSPGIQVEISLPHLDSFDSLYYKMQAERKRFFRFLEDESKTFFPVEDADDLAFMQHTIEAKKLTSKFFLGASGFYRTSKLMRISTGTDEEKICWLCRPRNDEWTDVTVIYPEFYETSFPTAQLVHFN